MYDDDDDDDNDEENLRLIVNIWYVHNIVWELIEYTK